MFVDGKVTLEEIEFCIVLPSSVPLWTGCVSKPMVPFWGRCITHFRTYFSGWIGMFTGDTIRVLTHGHIASKLVVPFFPFFGEGSPTKIDNIKNGTLIYWRT